MGKLAEIKTKQNASSVEDFINSLPDEQKRKDCFLLLEMMAKSTKEEPKMWGKSIIGFDLVRYKSPKTGREVDWFKIGFSPRKSDLSLHLMNLQRHADHLAKLGKHKSGVGCLYINKISDVDLNILEKIIVAAGK